MRSQSGVIWDVWNRGGPFIGEVRPIGRVTVDVNHHFEGLHTASDAGIWDPSKLPVRWFQREANDQVEQEVPNIRSINIDRSLDTDAGTCDITMSNQWMNANTGELSAVEPYILAEPGERDPRVLGEPGFFTWNHGASAEARARWGQTQTTWWNILVPNALLRTYQGFGGAYPMSIDEAVATGYLTLTGVWLVDEVRVGSTGEVSLRCRDMAKLLIEQQLYPPLVPMAVYPLRYCRWTYAPVTHQNVTAAATSTGERALQYETSANLAWYANGTVHGHNPAEAFDNNYDTFYLSVGNSGPEEPYAVEWVQATCGEMVDFVWVRPWAGNYTCYVSIMENGAWVNEIGTIPYQEAGVGRYNGAYEARIPAVIKAGVPWEAPVSIKLPRAYRAERIRWTFTNLAHSEWGPYPYRAGVRELRAGLNDIPQTVETVTEIVRSDGNYKDFSDIVRELLLWAGWWLASAAPFPAPPEVFGNIESTGSYSEDCFPADIFDKRPVIDGINAVKETVGYIFWVDEDGGARFESPNWWQPGNFLTTGQHTETIPEVSESVQLTAYAVSWSDKAVVSSIYVSTEEPYQGTAKALVTQLTPPSAATLKGITKPLWFTNLAIVKKEEQETMAELIALHIHFRQRLGNVTAVANPMIQINDQVRIFERMASETYIHYVRGMSTQYDAEAGTYTMTLTTHWLGDGDTWAVA